MHRKLLAIPVFNEQERLPGLLARLSAHKPYVLFVDDGSSDSSRALIRQHGFQLIGFGINRGLSEVYRQIFSYARQTGVHRLLLMDADGQHEPENIPAFFHLLNQQPFVSGRRFDSLATVPTYKVASNLFACQLVRELFGLALPDVACGFRGFNLQMLTPDQLELTGNERFEGFYALLFQLLSSGIRPAYLPIKPIYHTNCLPGTPLTELRGLIGAASDFDKHGLIETNGLNKLIDTSQTCFVTLGDYTFRVTVPDEKLARFELVHGDPEKYFSMFS
ncbi:MAG: glycosyltransferase family 2 protein [Bacteroidetes bacterium]|nr:glycosyltransferase family 2 protein [Bacteroidota bacterium]